MNSKKPLMNTLMHVGNIFGTYEGKIAPYVLTILIGSIPLWIWLFFLQGTFIKLWMAIVVLVLLTARCALYFIGNEPEKMKFYVARRSNAYMASKDLVNIVNIYEDGLIEYGSGRVAYIISAYLKGYLNDDKLSIDLEAFMNELDAFDWDMSLYNITDELKCTNSLPLLRNYQDRDAIMERMNFYKYQDDWTATHTGLYQLVFVVKTRKVDWKKMKLKLTELVDSAVAGCFNEVQIENNIGVNKVLSRDVTTFVDLTELLLDKYTEDTVQGARVLFFDDADKEVYKEQKKVGVDLNKRRVTLNARK